MKAARRGRRNPGRPPGSAKRLLADPQRFALAIAYTGRTLGLGPRYATFLALALSESEQPITIETIHDALVLVSSPYKGHVELENRAAALDKKLNLTMTRIRQPELKWLSYSAAALVSLLNAVAAENERGFSMAIEMLKGAGWFDVLARVHCRLDKALRSNFPEFDGELSAAAIELLSKQLKQHGFRE